MPAPSGREPLAKPDTLRLSRNVCRHAKGPISEGAGCDQREQTGGVSAGTPSVTACAVPAPPRGRLWHCRKVCRYAGNGLALSVIAARCHLSQREWPWQYGKVSGFARGSPFGGAGALAPERASPFGTAVQPCGSTSSREKAMLENPQIFQHCKFKNIFSAEHGQSAAEAILNRAVPGSTPSVTACAVPAPPRGRLWHCRKVCHHRPKPSPWGRWIAAKRQDGRGNAAVYRCAPSVKRQCWKIRRFSSIANLKIYFPLNMARAQRRPF